MALMLHARRVLNCSERDDDSAEKLSVIKEYLRLFQIRTRVCPLRVRRFVH